MIRTSSAKERRNRPRLSLVITSVGSYTSQTRRRSRSKCAVSEPKVSSTCSAVTTPQLIGRQRRIAKREEEWSPISSTAETAVRSCVFRLSRLFASYAP